LIKAKGCLEMNAERGRVIGQLVSCVGLAMVLGHWSPVFAQPVTGPERDVKEAGTPTPPEPPSMKEPPATTDAVVAADDGPAFPVSQFVFEYAISERDGLPASGSEFFDDIMVTWGVTADGAYVTPTREEITASGPRVVTRTDVQIVTMTLREFREKTAERPAMIHKTGIKQVLAELSRRFVQEIGVRGMFSLPNPEDISPSDDDLREGRTSLRISMYVPVVSRVRTIAGGDRITGEKIDNPAHDRIRRNSPVQADGLLMRESIDEYIYRLNRHPGRRVDAAVASAGDPENPESVYFDYLVSENRPWTAYFQLSNTGTDSTSQWRERFGFSHNQLTGHDDVLRLDYITAGFDESHAIVGSYDIPLADKLGARIYGSWSRFDASELGASGLERYKGESSSAGAELTWTAAQFDETFLDIFAGMKWQFVAIEQTTLGTSIPGANASFILPYVGARIQRDTDASSSMLQVSYEWSMSDLSGAERDEVSNGLGRLGANLDWHTVSYEASTQFYLEPLFNPTDPKYMTLAHELAFSVRGQWIPYDDRLIPYFQQTAGGLYTVRGYPESAAAGDDVVVASAEYRFHLPRIFTPDATGDGSFAWRPQGPYGRPDWDLIFKGFVDAGRTKNSDIETSFESDETLVGAGIGAELQISRNFNFRVDWGVALKEIDGRSEDGGVLGDPVSKGSSQVHIALTLLY
jgi:hemolysin activation/secretion protein